MKARFPDLAIAVNGGIESLDDAAALPRPRPRRGDDRPRRLPRAGAPRRRRPAIFGAAGPDVAAEDGGRGDAALHRGRAAAAARRSHAITRHMLGAFQGRPGARAWRRRPLGGRAPRRAPAPSWCARARRDLAARRSRG